MKKHDALHEFPDMKEKIHELKTSDHHFKKIFDEYHDVDHEIHRIESGAENTKDEELTILRKQRLSLKDKIYSYLMH